MPIDSRIEIPTAVWTSPGEVTGGAAAPTIINAPKASRNTPRGGKGTMAALAAELLKARNTPK
jgi:hypothetical protein